jgi:hypothetical protein
VTDSPEEKTPPCDGSELTGSQRSHPLDVEGAFRMRHSRISHRKRAETHSQATVCPTDSMA